jgi:hypothetical protein
LEREGLESNRAFETWRRRRISQGFHEFAVEHGDDAETPPSERGFPAYDPNRFYRGSF